MSAVSKTVMPASSAACTTPRAAAGSRRPPKLLQPSPIGETRKSVVPNGRSRMRVPRRLAQHGPRIAAEDQIARFRFDRQSSHAGNAIQVTHIEWIIASQQDVVMAGDLDEEFECSFRMRDRVKVQTGDRFGRRIF